MARPKTHKTKPHQKNKRHWRWIIAFGLALILLVGAFAGYVWLYETKILPNVTIGGLKVGGQKPEAVRQTIEVKNQFLAENNIKVAVDENLFEESAANLDIAYDADALAAQAMRVGHNQRFGRDMWEHLRALFTTTRIDALASNQPNLENWVASIAARVDEPPQETNLEVQDGQALVVDAKVGQTIDQKDIVGRIADTLSSFQPVDLQATRHETAAQITRADAEALAQLAIELTSQPLKLAIGDQKFTVLPNKLGGWIELKVRANDTAGNSITPVAYATDHEVYVSFNDSDIKTYLEDIATKVNQEPKDARFAFSGDKVTVFQSSTPGKVLNVNAAAATIIAALETQDQRELTIALEDKKAAIDNDVANNIAKYGIKELVGTATTNFVKSPSNRIHNIKNGASFLNGVLLAPGEEFSTIGHLGAIDGSTGYLPELVIKEDRTVPEFGGGLCQVSTTLFRAAMQAGLKITERQNHSYRVSYYEPPIGMDATIYSPRPDLKFVNNTPSYILIQSHVEGTKITFDLYGTTDGRRVEISDPQMYDVTEPGEPIYIEDSSLAPGETKQIEKAHAGAKAVFTYKVFNADSSVKFEQTFKSSYVAWPAKILKGPDAPPQPVETPPAAPATQ